jgi:hypothetical protein
VDELLGTLVDRMDSEEPQLYVHLYSCLRDLLEAGTHVHADAACAQTPDKQEMVGFKARWKRFLQDHGRAIRDGKHFKMSSPEVRRLICPDSDDER